MNNRPALFPAEPFRQSIQIDAVGFRNDHDIFDADAPQVGSLSQAVVTVTGRRDAAIFELTDSPNLD